MKKTYTVKTSISIDAAPEKVWKALTDPKLVKKYLFGADLKTTWKEGSPIVYTGEWEGKPYEEKGIVKKVEPGKLLQNTSISSMSGLEDIPENYFTVTYKISQRNGKTALTITQENIKKEKAIEGSKANWKMVLKGLKDVLEKKVATSSKIKY